MSHRATRRKAATVAVADALDALANGGPVEPLREAFERLMRLDRDLEVRGTYQRDLEAATNGLRLRWRPDALRTLAGDYRALAAARRAA